MIKRFGLAVGIGLLVWGIWGSVSEWREFRFIETNNYGQGPDVVKTLQNPAEKMYQNDLVGVRIKHPKDWAVTTNPKLIGREAKWLGEKVRVADFGGVMSMYIERTDKELVDVADEMARVLPVSRERDYYNTNQVSIIVLTYKIGDVEKQVALVKKFGTKLVTVEQSRVGGWEEILKSIVIF